MVELWARWLHVWLNERLLVKYKLLIIDVDGTLVGKSGTISTADKGAVIKALRSGMKVSLSTGRVAQSCVGIINELSLAGYHMFFDGAWVGNFKGEEVYAQPVKKEVVRRAVEFARLNDIYLELYSATNYFIERETWATRVHREFFGIVPTKVDLTTLWDKERIIKGELFVSSSEEDTQARTFENRFGDRLRFSWANTPAFPGVYFVNVVDPGVSKGKALEALASHFGVSMEEVMAIGDGVNDIPLLSTAGLAIAMGNAPDELKAVADHVTLDVEHSGLAAAVDKFLVT